jgi:hypothetical protein
MFEKDDEVILKESAGPFDPGARGVVKTITETDVLQVDIHTDESEQSVEPPYPLPPLPASLFRKA